MKISRRDIEIVSFVARFGQVTGDHARRVIFKDNSSLTPCVRALNRLTSQKLLARVEKRTVGGAKGGSGQYVYQLGSAGWKLSSAEGAFWLARSVNYHSIAIADVYTSIVENLDIIRFETEPDSHVRINHYPLLPDLYVELKLGSRERRAWVEVDLGTERPRQLKDKMDRYHHAWSGAPEAWDPWPLVVWVVPDDKRSRELQSLIAQTPRESQPMYRVCVFENVVECLSN